MGQLILLAPFEQKLNTVFSVQDLKERYLPGIPLPESVTESSLSFFIDSAISELENFLTLKIPKQIVHENKDFYRDDWVNWNYLRVTYPVVCPISLEGYLGTTRQITYPREWMSTRKTSDGKLFHRSINMVPTRNSTTTEALIYSGVMPNSHYTASKTIPNYWSIKYVTGWDVPPPELLDVIGMMTSIKVLQIISDALMSGSLRKVVNQDGQDTLAPNGTSFGGVGFGLSSKSISIDGLSQSYSTYVNGQTGVWGARLKQYAEILDVTKPNTLLNRLYDTYTALTMGVA